MEDKKQITLVEAMKLMGIDEIADFKPTAMVITGLDMLLYVEKDVSYTSRRVPGSNISILYSNTSPERVVGVEIWGFSEVFVPPEPLPKDTERFRRLAPDDNDPPVNLLDPAERIITTTMLRRKRGVEGPAVI